VHQDSTASFHTITLISLSLKTGKSNGWALFSAVFEFSDAFTVGKRKRYGHMAGLPAALGAVHQNRKAAPGQKLDRLGNGRKLRGIEAADPQSIIADDGNIVRDALSGVRQWKN